jgi:hypothetical protein
MTLLGTEQLSETFRIATLVVPLAVYFGLLGLLNTRRHPQLLTGRQDLALLMIALSPLGGAIVMPLFGAGWIGLGVLALLLGGVIVLAPSSNSWVVYNLTLSEARRLARSALQEIGQTPNSPDQTVFEFQDGRLELWAFPILRNVTFKLCTDCPAMARQFEKALERRLTAQPCEASPMALSMLLVATAMLIAPAALMLQQMPEIVRLLGDLMP